MILRHKVGANGSPIPFVSWSSFKRSALIAAAMPLVAYYGLHAQGATLKLIVAASYLYCMAAVLLGHRHVDRLLRAASGSGEAERRIDG